MSLQIYPIHFLSLLIFLSLPSSVIHCFFVIVECDFEKLSILSHSNVLLLLSFILLIHPPSPLLLSSSPHLVQQVSQPICHNAFFYWAVWVGDPERSGAWVKTGQDRCTGCYTSVRYTVNKTRQSIHKRWLFRKETRQYI